MKALRPNQSIEGEQSSGTMLKVSRPRIRIADLEYHVFEPRTAEGPLFERAYVLWRDAWTATFRELEGITRIDSDEFTRQDEIGVLVRDQSCVSVTGVRWLDLSRPTSIDDSYFRVWPEESLRRLAAARVGISSNTVVSPEWRGCLLEPPARAAVQPMPLKQATIGMSLRRFASSAASVFVGVARNDRGMHRVAEGLNGHCIATIPVHGIASDIMLWTQEDVADLGPLIGELWDRRAHR